MSLYTETITTAIRKTLNDWDERLPRTEADGLGDLNPIERGTAAVIHKVGRSMSFRNSAVAEQYSAKPIEAYAALPPGGC